MNSEGLAEERMSQDREASPSRSIWERDDYVTLYRYELPSGGYNQAREGVVSRQELVGTWFTDNLEDLKTYIKSRQPGGNIVAIRIPGKDASEHDAALKPETRNMDIEKGNYIVPESTQTGRIEIPLEIGQKLPNKFLLSDWPSINRFVEEQLSHERLASRAANQP